ncbi:MAG: SCO family protein [Bacteroidales bacterium]
MKYLYLIIANLIILNCQAQTNNEISSPEIAPLGVYEKLDQFLPDNLLFRDENAKVLNLKNAIDKPTVLAMVYYECPGICTPLLNGLAEVVQRSNMELGKDYQVFTVSFNHLENSQLASKKKKTYLKLAGQEEHADGWKFFTGDSLEINNLLQSIGYYVKQEGKEFIHPATLVVLGKDGKITRYLHGTNFLPFDLKMAVSEASEGRSGPTINKVLEFCFSYDAEGKKYVLNTTKISGSLIILMALILFTSLTISGKRKKKHQNSV